MHAATRRSGHAASAMVAAGLVAALMTAGLAACSRGSARSERHRLVTPREVTVVEAGGGRHAGIDGERLPPGSTVLTAPTGSVALAVRGRRVLLAGDSTVAVVDGAAVDVRRGRVLIDRRQGPDLRVSAGGSTVSRFRSAAVRVERGLDLRVSALTGSARVRSESARTVELPALHQLTIVGAALPSAAAPLSLLRDTWERDTIERVVETDELLDRLARDVDTGIGTAKRAVTVVSALAPVAATLPVGAPASEALLPAAIGRAGRGGTPAERHASAADLRGRGGSWGVVAALLGARGLDVAQSAAMLMIGGQPGGEAPIVATGPIVVSTPPAGGDTPSPATATRPTGAAGPVSAATGTAPPTGPGTGPRPAAGPVSGGNGEEPAGGDPRAAGGGGDDPDDGASDGTGGDRPDGPTDGGGDDADGDADGDGDGDGDGSVGGQQPAPTPTRSPPPAVPTPVPTAPAPTSPPPLPLPTVTLIPLPTVTLVPLPSPSLPVRLP